MLTRGARLRGRVDVVARPIVGYLRVRPMWYVQLAPHALSVRTADDPAALRTGRKDFLETACKLANKFFELLPESGVPWW